jgi:hypothetical protein
MNDFLDLQSVHRAGVKLLVLTVGLVSPTFTFAGENLSFLPDRGDANLTFYLDNDLFANRIRTGTAQSATLEFRSRGSHVVPEVVRIPGP